MPPLNIHRFRYNFQEMIFLSYPTLLSRAELKMNRKGRLMRSNIYIYIYIYIYIFICIYWNVCVDIYIYRCISPVYKYIYIYIYKHISSYLKLAPYRYLILAETVTERLLKNLIIISIYIYIYI